MAIVVMLMFTLFTIDHRMPVFRFLEWAFWAESAEWAPDCWCHLRGEAGTGQTPNLVNLYPGFYVHGNPADFMLTQMNLLPIRES